ncbi:flagellar protein export ATPase FliI [Paenibacillus larvae]|uniref:Flagellum-specific ATP synthase FliI n=4 Tax=Paenibacillus larvae TaxID=1464 RepID=V9W7R5_9BACL|nr:flagellar protein export ATPase FliI [Paenibacillus larvae]AHD05959.1 flagellum-specific ATP synthase FliI [Paenibacillus larvae subsp. larvae DSM 25430]AVF22547.1 flagellum-specific ATP synthase FliI [Paenibacillus larvae subsp. larvae]AVF26879.1 flagellum-specific ATP synthase FliI [Paenibacillus larvae subsp. larvae]AVF31630.1 flagellum-specific ATP synthase FliI [Paenibacillus larvae subsp. larvae]AVG12496.1 flagellum-specific ATP synthase FliI [Paenibacillus larvae subsp. larvae DSM 25
MQLPSPQKYIEHLQQLDPVRVNGKVTQVIGLTVESEGPDASIGDVCYIYPLKSDQPLKAEVVGFRDNKVILMPLGELDSIGPGCDVVGTGKPLTVPVGHELLGKVLDGLGQPLDGSFLPSRMTQYSTNNSPNNPLQRPRVLEPLGVGVKCIDGLLTIGRGQRVGIFAGSGVGKSTLMGMIARNTEADVNVIALIGERGREVLDFIERDLGPEGLARSVVIVATSDQPALIRIKGALIATSIAEYFRDRGLNVMLMMDSVTRFAMAQREVGLAVGEPPATRGYTPSVFALLPKLLERSGNGPKGSITAFYTVLVDGDDMNEPIADAVRGILDGHIVLDRNLAHKGHYPAIDVLSSVSRVMKEIVSDEQQSAADQLKRLLAIYRDSEDLINLGAYQKGSNPDIDLSLQYIESIWEFTRQKTTDKVTIEQAKQQLIEQFYTG